MFAERAREEEAPGSAGPEEAPGSAGPVWKSNRWVLDDVTKRFRPKEGATDAEDCGIRLRVCHGQRALKDQRPVTAAPVHVIIADARGALQTKKWLAHEGDLWPWLQTLQGQHWPWLQGQRFDDLVVTCQDLAEEYRTGDPVHGRLADKAAAQRAMDARSMFVAEAQKAACEAYAVWKRVQNAGAGKQVCVACLPPIRLGFRLIVFTLPSGLVLCLCMFAWGRWVLRLCLLLLPRLRPLADLWHHARHHVRHHPRSCACHHPHPRHYPHPHPRLCPCHHPRHRLRLCQRLRLCLCHHLRHHPRHRLRLCLCHHLRHRPHPRPRPRHRRRPCPCHHLRHNSRLRLWRRHCTRLRTPQRVLPLLARRQVASS